jgi:E3 ubiquitin-protein ligase CHFR
VAHLQSQPTGFKPLIELDLFVDLHSVAPGVDPNPDAPRARICRLCAAEVLLWGLKEWWIRERQKGFLDETVSRRKDCPEGSGCSKQKDLGSCFVYLQVTIMSNGCISFTDSTRQRMSAVLLQIADLIITC